MNFRFLRHRVAHWVGRGGGIAAAVLCVLTLPAVVASSKPVPVSAEATTLRQAAEAHHITIGTAAAARLLEEPDYATILGSEFRQLQPENEMKFAPIHPRPDTDPNPYDFEGADALVAFAQSHNMVVRGHTLVWHRQVPKWISEGKYTAQQLAEILHGHIRTVMTRYASKVYAWDVVNEAFNEDGTMRSTIWYDRPGIGAGEGTKYIEQAFRWAHEADPNAKLFYNDYEAEAVNKKSDAIYEMAKDFKARGVPLDGIGFQSHLTLKFDDPTKIESYAQNLERFRKLGLDLHITELDIRLGDTSDASLKAQAKLYGEIITLCVQQSACKVFQTWGFTDKHSWIPQSYKDMGWALLWDADYHKKPAYEAVDGVLGKQRPKQR